MQENLTAEKLKKDLPIIYDIVVEQLGKDGIATLDKWMQTNSIPMQLPVKPATCGKCEDCKFWFISPEQEEMRKASMEDIGLHERCNNEDCFVYGLPTYNYFGCVHFSKLSV